MPTIMVRSVPECGFRSKGPCGGGCRIRPFDQARGGVISGRQGAYSCRYPRFGDADGGPDRRDPWKQPLADCRRSVAQRIANPKPTIRRTSGYPASRDHRSHRLWPDQARASRAPTFPVWMPDRPAIPAAPAPIARAERCLWTAGATIFPDGSARDRRAPPHRSRPTSETVDTPMFRAPSQDRWPRSRPSACAGKSSSVPVRDDGPMMHPHRRLRMAVGSRRSRSATCVAARRNAPVP